VGCWLRQCKLQPSDLTDAEWALVKPLIPPTKRGGGKRTVKMREVVNGVMYVLSTGCQWRYIPKDLPPRSTVILLNERVELKAMTSDALVAMIKRKLEEYGLKKVVPNADLLAETYRAFHRRHRLRERFTKMEQLFDKEVYAADIPDDLAEQVRAVLAEHTDLRWDDAIQIVLDEAQLSRVRAAKEKAKQIRGV
jgi:transposase